MPTTSTIFLKFVEASESNFATSQIISFREDDKNEFFEIAVDTQQFENLIEYTTLMRDAFVELFSQLVGTYMTTRDPAAYLERVVGSEEGFRRALTFNDMVTTASNVFSNDSEETLKKYTDSTEAIAKTASRSFKAKFELISQITAHRVAPDQDGKETEFGDGEIPKEFLEPTNLGHRSRRVVSPINSRKWDRAKWRGCGFMSGPGIVPVFGLIFTDEKAALTIFEEWLKSYGHEDVNDEIRVSIVGQLSRRDPHGYGVTVGGNFENANLGELESAIMISRVNFMDHPNPQNLGIFLDAFVGFGGYLLAPIIAKSDLSDGKFLPEYGLRKRHLSVRNAWEIGQNDPDCIVLKPDHDPIIPAGVENPPVLKALERIRARASFSSPSSVSVRPDRSYFAFHGSRSSIRLIL